MTDQSVKKAVQFGAGNIGRGFIGILLAQAGYQLTFVDVVEAVVTALNERGQYSVVEIDSTGVPGWRVTPISRRSRTRCLSRRS